MSAIIVLCALENFSDYIFDRKSVLAVGSFDFRSFQKYFNPQASGDLNAFLEKLPQNAGQSALIAAGIAWLMVAALGLFTVMQMQNLTELRAELLQSEALVPMVPVISKTPVAAGELKDILNNFKTLYPGLTFTAKGSSIMIQSKTTGSYGQFREAMGHVVNGGSGWQTSIEDLCIGRECKQNALSATVKIQKLEIDKPSSSSTM